jgi:hypothetical protein
LLDHRDATERAQRLMRGEPVAPEPPTLPRRLALDWGEEFDSPMLLLCPACGSTQLEPRGAAHVEAAAAVFVACLACAERFAVEFVTTNNALAVGVYEPTPE